MLTIFNLFKMKKLFVCSFLFLSLAATTFAGSSIVPQETDHLPLVEPDLRIVVTIKDGAIEATYENDGQNCITVEVNINDYQNVLTNCPD
jgi:hypothetical protein